MRSRQPEGIGLFPAQMAAAVPPFLGCAFLVYGTAGGLAKRKYSVVFLAASSRR